MEKKTRIAVIGLGGRGYHMMRDVLLAFEDVDVPAVCDLYPDRNERAAKLIEEKKGYVPFTTTDYNEILARGDIDAVYIPSAWEYHVSIAIAAMKAVGVEPEIVPIRGGTDGARLSFTGLPCPNICTGGENFHSRFEYLPVESLEKVVDIVERIVLDLVK